MDFQLDLSILLMRILRSENLPKITQDLTGGTKIQTDPEPTFLTPLYVANLHSTFFYLPPPRVTRFWFKLGFMCFMSRVKPFSAPLMRHEQFSLWEACKNSWYPLLHGAGALPASGCSPAFWTHPEQLPLLYLHSQLTGDVPTTPSAGGSFTLN